MRKYKRRSTGEFSRLGRGRKKKQVWRKPRGRDNKMREGTKSRPKCPKIGEKKPSKLQGKIRGLDIVKIRKIEDLKKAKDNIIKRNRRWKK